MNVIQIQTQIITDLLSLLDQDNDNKFNMLYYCDVEMLYI